MMRFLVDHGANLNQPCVSGATALYMASQQRHLIALRYLIAAGADVDLQDCHGCTATYAAAHQGALDVLRLLIDAGLWRIIVDRIVEFDCGPKCSRVLCWNAPKVLLERSNV